MDDQLVYFGVQEENNRLKREIQDLKSKLDARDLTICQMKTTIQDLKVRGLDEQFQGLNVEQAKRDLEICKLEEQLKAKCIKVDKLKAERKLYMFQLDSMNNILSHFEGLDWKYFHVVIHKKVFKQFYLMFVPVTRETQMYQCSCLCANEHAHLIIRSVHDLRDKVSKRMTWGVRVDMIKTKTELMDVQVNAIKYSIMRNLTKNLNCSYNVSFDEPNDSL